MASEARSYSIFFKPSALGALASLAEKEKRQVSKRVEALAQNPRPHGYEQLKGERRLYRIRSGDYRIIYTIEETALKVLVLAIANRKDAYR